MMFAPKDMQNNVKDLLDKGGPPIQRIEYLIPSCEVVICIMNGKKSDHDSALSFWIHAMDYHCKETNEDDHQSYLDQRELWIKGKCEEISLDEFKKTISGCGIKEPEDFKFPHKPISLMKMTDEWNEQIVVFETMNEYGVFYWFTSA